MITCEVFELEIELINGERPVLRYKFWTELPAGTLANIDCTRSYVDHTDERMVWTLFDDRVTIQPSVHGDFNGNAGEIDILAGDGAALAEFEESLSSLSSGITGPVSDEITVSVVIGARQRLRAFGPRNENLDGEMVREDGGIRVISVEKKVVFPLRKELSPVNDEEPPRRRSRR